jgi:hypothetical protein
MTIAIITAIIITFLVACSNRTEGFPTLVATTLTKRFNVSETVLAVRAYSNKGNVIRIQQSVEIRPGDIENLHL